MKKTYVVLFLSFCLHFVLEANPGSNIKAEIIGSGPSMVLIPDLAVPGAVWEPFATSLKDSYQSHLITLPGFALQPPIEYGDNYLDSMVNEVRAYLTNNIEGKATLVGHSLGGYIAMKIAADNPELVEELILVDAYPYFLGNMYPSATVGKAKPLAYGFKQMLALSPESMFNSQQKKSLKTMVTSEQDLDSLVQWAINSDRSTVIQAMYELMINDLREDVSKISCPALVLVSAHISRKEAPNMEQTLSRAVDQYKNLKGSIIKVAPTAKHFIMMDQPDWFLEQSKTFLGVPKQ